MSRADGLLRREAHLWLWVAVFCVDTLHLFEILLLSLLSPMHSLLFLLRGLSIFFANEKRKNNDSFEFAGCLRSFVPREISKFIKCAPAEVLKRGRKCLSFIFIHEALEGDGKGDWRSGDGADLQPASLCRRWWVPAASTAVRAGPCQAGYRGVLCIMNAFLGRSFVCCGGSRLGTVSSPLNPAYPPLWHQGSQNQAELGKHSWKTADCLEPGRKTCVQSTLN